ncbi:DUF362 domain-containing protein [Candidatus Latescibacterota bacterium]
MVSRRTFFKTSAAISALGLTKPIHAIGSRLQTSSNYFGVHPFVEKHPDAVFVMRTDVDAKTNSEAIKNSGIRFTRSVMLPMDEGGIPLTHMIPIKPNLTDSLSKNKDFSLEYGMGIVTDPYFVEGVIEGMKELGLSGKQFYIREVNAPENFEPRGYTALAERTGADLRDLFIDVREIGKEFVQWVDVPDGVVHRKIPYLWPVNASDTFYLNIAKFKTHGTGLTLCCKNHQGSVAHKYQRFCHGRGYKNYHYDYLAPDAEKKCEELYEKHLAEGLPYWKNLVEPGKENSLWLDMWCQRTLDSLSVSRMGLCVIEGVYGREGCFLWGPNPPLHNNKGIKEARDYMTNIIIFGKNPILVDIIGHWLGGHEPGQFGFFHLAMERGLNTVLDPRKIPVYQWENGAATLTPLELFPRTPLLSDYVPKDQYFQQKPTKFYMYDDPFDYSKVDEYVPVVSSPPGARIFDRFIPNPVNPFIIIEYSLPESDYSRLDILDENSNRIETLVNGYRQKGSHCTVWNIKNRAKGTYYYRFLFADFSETRELVLMI